jgi:membrane protein
MLGACEESYVKQSIMRQVLDNLFLKKIWKHRSSAGVGFKKFPLEALRLLYLVARDLLDGQLTLRAMSLVYTTLLALVPLLAFSFSVLKAFGVHNQLEPLLANYLTPLGPKGGEITEQILGFVENVQVGVLGALGLALLIYTVFSLIQKIENSLNFIWNVRKPRSLAQRFSEYLSVILIGPVLVFTAVGITAAITSTAIVQKLVAIDAIGTGFYLVGRLVPYVLVCGTFTFFYMFIPNTRVRFVSALTGGIVAGVLWETTGWAFASFIASSTNYAAIYSSFAILILFLIWLYLSWLILLTGAQVSYYHQHPHVFTAVSNDQHRFSGAIRERLVLLTMFLIGSHHYHNKELWTTQALALRLGVSIEAVDMIVEELVSGGFVVETAADPVTYIPAKDIEKITVQALLQCARGADPVTHLAYEKLCGSGEINRLMQKVSAAIEDALGDETIRSLVLAHDESQPSVANVVTDDSPEERKKAY